MKEAASVDWLRYANVGANLKARELPNNITRVRFMRIWEIMKEKRDQILTIANRYGGWEVRIFGPIVRGEGKRHSD